MTRYPIYKPSRKYLPKSPTVTFLIVAFPGIVLIGAQIFCELYPTLYEIINPLLVLLAVPTVGIPCILGSAIFYVLYRIGYFGGNSWPWPVLSLILVLLTIPSFIIYLIVLANIDPDQLTVFGYSIPLYILTVHFWVPPLLFWGWLTRRLIEKRHGALLTDLNSRKVAL